MKNNYIYVPGLSESVADEVKKEKDAEAPRFITGTGAVKKEAVPIRLWGEFFHFRKILID